MSFMATEEAILALQPESGAGGYTAYDGTVAFYSRVRALLRPDMRVLDFGAGRGAWYEDDTATFRRNLRLIRGSVQEVVGCDTDPAVLTNRSLDKGYVIDRQGALPFLDDSVDLIVCDYVVEHIDDPEWLAAEFRRVLKPGGWVCARTPTKFNYVSLAARVIANARHQAILKKVQPTRKSEDIFPTAYKLNTKADCGRYFRSDWFVDHSYIYSFEPQYHFGRAWVYRFFRAVHGLVPASLKGNLYLFLQKRPETRFSSGPER
jgi:SAM-dependent methyltransferase